MNIDMLTDDEVVELQERLILRAAHIAVTPDVEAIVRARLATHQEDRQDALPWNDALRLLER